MAESIRVGAHSCVINPKDKDAGPQVGDEYGRMFPGLAPCEVDKAAMIDLRASSRDLQRVRPTLPSAGPGLFTMVDPPAIAAEKAP